MPVRPMCVACRSAASRPDAPAPSAGSAGDFFVAADKRGEIALSGTTAATTDTNKLVQRCRFGTPLSV